MRQGLDSLSAVNEKNVLILGGQDPRCLMMCDGRDQIPIYHNLSRLIGLL